MIHHLLLVLLVVHGVMADDAMVLWTFKKTSILLDQRNSLQNWIGVGAAVCSWAGVTCGTGGHVTGLNLANLGLSGRLIIGDLMALPALATIDLSGNSFYGDLSYSSTVCSFVSVDLSRNNFTGKITSNFLTICPNLISLNLSRNSITGGIYPIPSTLQSLDVSDNWITDVALLTNSLTLCRAMKYLNFSSNRLPGGLSVPAAPCTGIVVFDLSNNPFSVPLPAGLVAGMPPALITLNLARCNISGDLTKADFGACRYLTSLDFSGNLLAGGPPASLANCRRLESLDLSGNRLSGDISKIFSNLTSLKRLLLSGNNFSGEIPPDLASLCPTIVKLDLSGNLLTGELPPSFSNCPALEILNLDRNSLSGNFVATVIPTLPSIRMLSVSFNNISAPTPLPQLKNCTKLEEIDLGSNALTGTIPTGLCTALPSLRRLLLPNNYITGELPRDIADCGVLTTIDLSFNLLGGTIPAEILTMPMMKDVVMWANNFSGEIPDVLCSKGSMLELLVLNHNSFTGRIPDSMTRCSNLKWVNLAGNRLTGSIPKTIGNMKRLGLLQLGNNELTGEIPEELGHCTNLMWVELSSNKLTGSIPATLSSQTSKVTPPFVGLKFAFLRNEAGTSCPGSGFMFEFEGIRPERLAAYAPVHLCPWTRIYTGAMMSPFRSNGSILYLDLSYNSLSGQIPESLGMMPYLIVLNLGHNQLTGSIPRSVGGLKSVGVIDLSYNKLSGPIPAEIGSLSFLNDLDLSNNNLSGTIPTSGQFMTFSASRFANNTFLCGSPLPPCSSSSSSTFMAWRSSKRRLLGTMVIGITVCTVILLSLLLLLFKIMRRQNKTEKHMSFVESLSRSRNDPWVLHGPEEPLSINVAMFGKDHLRKLTFGHLVEATNGFSSESLIGSGGFGEVYRAKLKDGNAVAIKKLIHVANQGDREFMAEMETIGKIKHRNLVPLLGYCKVGDERLLVYQFMMHGSLDDVLHGGGVLGERTSLDWPARKKIAIGAGKGLAFLHHTCIPHIIHRDMKSSNVLVDEDMEARVSDFGMARLVNALDTHLSVSSLTGTPGYVPPEYYQSFRCTTRGDVYSFGVVLLELLSGKRPTGLVEFGDSNLVGWAKQLIRDERAMEVLDKEIVADNAELEKWLKLTLHCLEDRPNRRPTMAQVVVKFKEFLQESGHEVVDSEESLESVELDEEPRESV